MLFTEQGVSFPEFRRLAMQHWRRFLIGTVAVAMASGAATFAASTAAVAKAGAKMQQGGSLTLLQQTDQPCLGDPTRVLPGPPQASPYMNAAFDNLVLVDLLTDEFKPEGIATSLTSKDGINWVMKLRPSVMFSDGTPLDAAAVKFNWDRDAQAASIYANGVPKSIKTLTVVDPQTLQIQLLTANRQLPAYIAYYNVNWIVSPKWLQTPGADICGKPVGAGPFVLDSRTSGVQTVYRRNPTYWNKPLPYLDTLTLKVNPDYQSSLDTVATGGADAAYIANTALAKGAQAKAAKLGYDGLINSGGLSLGFNSSKPPFNDVRARQAVSWALDPVKITKAIYPADEPATTLFTKASPYYNPKIKAAVNDPKKAQALLDQLAAEGKPLSFSVTSSPAPDVRQTAEAIQTQLAAYKNVTVKVVALDGAGFGAALSTSNYDAVMAGASAPNPEPVLATYFQTNGTANSNKFSDPAVDQILEQGRNAATVADAKSAYAKLQQLLNIDVPNVFYMHTGRWYVHSGKTAGFDRQGGSQGILVDRIGFVKKGT
jgi:peptide/nickel transport system substrate-binding protein